MGSWLTPAGSLTAEAAALRSAESHPPAWQGLRLPRHRSGYGLRTFLVHPEFNRIPHCILGIHPSPGDHPPMAKSAPHTPSILPIVF